MYITPKFSIKANGNELAKALVDRVSRVVVSQKSGLLSDTCTVELDNHACAPVALPGVGDALSVSLGYLKDESSDDTKLTDFGRFEVGEFALRGPRDSLALYGDQLRWHKGFKSPLNKSWPSSQEAPLTLGKLVGDVAAKYALEAKVSSELSSLVLPQLEQSESDMQLLTRLAGCYDAVAKVMDPYLLFIPRGSGRSASGQAIEEVVIGRAKVKRWHLLDSQFPGYASCTAWYHDLENAKRVPVTLGSGEPSFDLKFSYADEITARLAAQSRLNQGVRGGRLLELELIGEPSLMAGGVLQLNQVHEGADGKWFVSEVDHILDSQGFVSRVRCEPLIA